MKKFFACIFFLLLLFVALFAALQLHTAYFIRQATEKTAQKLFQQPDTTEVFVLGTLHRTTALVDYDDLYNLLETIKPNVILFETDSSLFDSHMNFKARWYVMKMPHFLDRYKQSNLEEIAVQKYIYHHNFAIVRPYEWALRDQFHAQHHILTTPDEIFSQLYELNAANQLKSEHKAILERYYDLTAQLDQFGDSSLYGINTVFQDSIAQERQNAQYHHIKTVVDNDDHFTAFRDFYKVNEAYWDIRNKAMADNIKKYISLFPKSRIVVLNGYFHRYYLRQELQGQQTVLGFKLKDIER